MRLYLKIAVVLFCFSLGTVRDVAAGGAVAQRQNVMRRQIQIQRQQQMVQQQMIIQQRAAQQAAAQAAVAAQQVQGQVQGQMMRAQVQAARQATAAQEVRAVATLDDVMNSLNDNSQAWTLIIDDEAKQAVVYNYISEFRSQGISINKSPQHYTQMVDSFIEASPDMLQQPFRQILQVMAIIEYDFNNGRNKDEMALKVLGSREAVRQNKQRLGL